MTMADLVATLDDMPEGWFRGPLPAPFDQTVAKVVDSYIGGEPEERAALLQGLDTDRSWILAGFAPSRSATRTTARSLSCGTRSTRSRTDCSTAARSERV
jgi:hypothetical protein